MDSFSPDKLSNLLSFDLQYIKSRTNECLKVIEGGTQLTLFNQPATGVIGVDEVGRGCLAGPVMAGAVMLPLVVRDSWLGSLLDRLNDSKQLSSGQREKLAKTIRACAWCAVGSASPEEIDQINILQASHLAMKRAVHELIKLLPEHLQGAVVLVDGIHPISGLAGKQVPVPKGDCLSASIAAASIIAKVQRDSFMKELATKYNAYGWHENKGYPSEDHREAISVHGRTEWHRKSFYSTTDKQLVLEFGP